MSKTHDERDSIRGSRQNDELRARAHQEGGVPATNTQRGDLRTRPGALDIASRLQRHVTESYERKGSNHFLRDDFPAAGWILSDKHPVVGQLPARTAYPCVMPADLRTQIPRGLWQPAWHEMLAQAAQMVDAWGVVVVALSVAVEHGQDVRTPEQHKAARAAMPADLSKVAGSLEVVTMVLDHRAVGTVGWVARIHRQPDRLGEWNEMDAVLSRGLLGGVATWRLPAPEGGRRVAFRTSTET